MRFPVFDVTLLGAHSAGFELLLCVFAVHFDLLFDRLFFADPGVHVFILLLLALFDHFLAFHGQLVLLPVNAVFDNRVNCGAQIHLFIVQLQMNAVRAWNEAGR